MNFLSHFYFDQHSTDPHLVLGTVLPDLVKNANGNWKIHPQKHPELFQHDPVFKSILMGWNRHLAVDKYFHSSPFFFKHTRQLRLEIAPLLTQTEVRPSFLAHISLELLLDGLLITESEIKVDNFYQHLTNSNRSKIEGFLKLNLITETDLFFKFFDSFNKSQYLNSYRDTHQIVYALNRICMRIWPGGLETTNQDALTTKLLNYQSELKADFREIYVEIDSYLKALPKN